MTRNIRVPGQAGGNPWDEAEKPPAAPQPPAQEPQAAGPQASAPEHSDAQPAGQAPSPTSLRSSAEIEADIATLERMRDEKALQLAAHEQQMARSYATVAAGQGNQGDDEEIQAALERGMRSLTRQIGAARDDLKAALDREERHRWEAFEAEFQKVLDQRNAKGDEIGRTVGHLCALLLELRAIQGEAIRMMQKGKSEVPQDRRKATLSLESMHAMANPSMLQRWTDIAVRRHLGGLWETDCGDQMQPFEDSIRSSSELAMEEMRFILNHGELAA